MNEKEVAEIRRRFRPEKSNITHVRGCYVNEEGQMISAFDQSLLTAPKEEAEGILGILKRTLSGTLGKNLIDVEFPNQQVIEGEQHRLLMALRDTALQDEEAVAALFQRIMEAAPLEGNYMILLTYDRYDVPYRSEDGERQEDAADQVYSYILCSICPVKMTQPALSYYAGDNLLHSREADWIVSPPELGFLFPAFDDRSANLYSTLFYTRNIAENHGGFADAVLGSEIPMPAAEQKETFQAVLEESLGEDCSYDVVQSVHTRLNEMVEEHKASREPQPLTVSRTALGDVLADCGLSPARREAFAQRYDQAFGADTDLPPKNILEKKLEVCTPDVTIQVAPEQSGLLEMQVINGVKYILIRADGDVRVNGVQVNIAEN